MPAAGVHQLGPTGDDARLRAAEELVSREGHQRRAGVEGLAGRGLALQPRRRLAFEPAAAAVEQAGPDVGHQRRAQIGQLGCAGRLGVAGEPEVRPVHLHYHRRVVVPVGQRRCVVGPAGAVGGADLDQAGARPGHHVGHSEPPADLDELAA